MIKSVEEINGMREAGKLAAVNASANAIEFVDDNAVVMAIALG